MNSIQTTYINTINPNNRADFNKESFDRLIAEKGREVVLEKCLVCPCKGEASNQLSSCLNCGGTGFVFYNPISTRMILSGIDASTKYAPWSEEARGKVSITAMMEEELSYMDRIKVVDGVSTFSEVVTLRRAKGKLFSYTAYDIEKISIAGLFISDDEPLLQLQPDQYEIFNNVFALKEGVITEETASIALRYNHNPAFHIIEFRRETMQTFQIKNNKEELINLPVSAYAERAHYRLPQNNLTKDWLLTNTFNT